MSSVHCARLTAARKCWVLEGRDACADERRVMTCGSTELSKGALDRESQGRQSSPMQGCWGGPELLKGPRRRGPSSAGQAGETGAVLLAKDIDGDVFRCFMVDIFNRM